MTLNNEKLSNLPSSDPVTIIYKDEDNRPLPNVMTVGSLISELKGDKGSEIRDSIDFVVHYRTIHYASKVDIDN